MSEEIRVYVACLASYNNGKLHGVWIDALEDIDDIQGHINDMLKNSTEPDSEEWAIHDYEGFGAYSVSEYEDIGTVHEIACFIDDYPEIAAELVNHFGGHIDDAKKAAEENYSGCYTSLGDYAREIDISDVSESLAYYIDYERMARDWELSGDIFTIETSHDEVHVFWSF